MATWLTDELLLQHAMFVDLLLKRECAMNMWEQFMLCAFTAVTSGKLCCIVNDCIVCFSASLDATSWRMYEMFTKTGTTGVHIQAPAKYFPDKDKTKGS